MQNSERTYKSDKESEAILQRFQFKQCAGSQKQEVIDEHSSFAQSSFVK
jgi:hypothetical protein